MFTAINFPCVKKIAFVNENDHWKFICYPMNLPIYDTFIPSVKARFFDWLL